MTTKPKLIRRRPPPSVPKPKRGRPAIFPQLDLEQVRKLARRGWTHEQMADFFGIKLDTWYKWGETQPGFFESLKSWKREYDYRIQVSLAESAEGYSHMEDRIFLHNGEPVIVPTRKHYPPNPTSMIFWLKNRLPELYRDVHRTEVTGKGGGPVQVSPGKPHTVRLEDFSEDELLLIARAGMKLNVDAGDEGDGEDTDGPSQ